MNEPVTHSLIQALSHFFHSTPSSSQEKQSGTIEFAEYLRDVTYKNYSTCDEMVVIVASQKDVQVGDRILRWLGPKTQQNVNEQENKV